MSEITVIEEVKKWVGLVVIGENFCPFARREFDNQRVRFIVEHSAKRRDVLEFFLEECRLLDTDPSIETTVMILPKGYNDFTVYLDLLDMLEELLLLEGYEGIYQVASFHPDYCFADADDNDPANYTNRSPYPLVHLLREASLEKAIASHPDVESIPENNIQRARELGLEQMKALLAQSKF